MKHYFIAAILLPTTLALFQGCNRKAPNGDPNDTPGETKAEIETEMVLISGGRDTIVPAIHARNYAAAGGSEPISTIVVDSAGHFELVTPEGRAWRELRKALRDLSAPARSGEAERE